MIIRSFAARHGRRALATPVSYLRTFATETSTPSSTLSPTLPPQTLPTPQNELENASEAKIAASTVAAPEAAPFWDPNVPKPLTKDIANIHLMNRRIKRKNADMGGVLHRRYVPQMAIDNPPNADEVTLELLMASQSHMGHNKGVWNPHTSRYVIGVREGIHIISLEETLAHLRRAAKVVEEIAYSGGLILFVGNRKGQMEIVCRAAELAGACHLFTKWKPGTFTNRDVIMEAGEMRVVDEQDRDVPGFEGFLARQRPILPDLVVVLNPVENYTLLHESTLADIPTIGIIDTDADPTLVTYPIPANDDSLRSIAVIAGALGRAGEKGQRRRREVATHGEVTWRNTPEMDDWMNAEQSQRKEQAIKDAEEGQAQQKLDTQGATDKLPGSDEMTLFGWDETPLRRRQSARSDAPTQ